VPVSVDRCVYPQSEKTALSKGIFRVVHDRTVIVLPAFLILPKRHLLQFVEIAFKSAFYITIIYRDMLVAVSSHLRVPKAKCVHDFMDCSTVVTSTDIELICAL